MHGANRLGGNGVANSTVFGGIAGDTMARWVPVHGAWQEPDEVALAEAIARAQRPFDGSGGGSSGGNIAGAIEELRECLYTTMWDDAGIVRDATGLARATGDLADMTDALRVIRLPATAHARTFNLAWHDVLNLTNLVAVSKVIVAAAQARAESRGAHFRADFDAAGPDAAAAFTRVQAGMDGQLSVTWQPVRFSRVQPGRSLLVDP